MKEQLINFETAKLAKEKGLNEYCSSFYSLNSVTNEFDLYDCNNNWKEHKNSNNPISISAPTQSLLQKWLR